MFDYWFFLLEVWDSLQARSANYLSRLRAFIRQTDDAIGLLEQLGLEAPDRC